MSNQRLRKFGQLKFSLRQLFMLTAFAAMCIAIAIAYRKNETLNQSRATLRSFSSRLQVTDEDELTFVTLPAFSSDFTTWEVHVPRGPTLELRFGIGDVSKLGIPTTFNRVELPAGRHRVTLYGVASRDDGNRFVVYLDGEQVIEKIPGPDWMPGGWSRSRGLSWPQGLAALELTPLPLAGQRYTPRLDLGKSNYFNGPVDGFVTGPGYRLWIDQPNRTYQPTSPFIGFQGRERYNGFGLRDGLRYRAYSKPAHELAFVRPKSRVRDSVLRIIPEFFVDEKMVLSAQTPTFSGWQLHSNEEGDETLPWTDDPQQTEYTAFLHAIPKSDEGVMPVIELKWDSDRPDEVGLRLAKTPANEPITQMRLKIIGGSKHLWRIIELGEQVLDSRKGTDAKITDSSEITVSLDRMDEIADGIQLNWKTDQSLPLQVLQRNRTKQTYSGIPLYQGLPVKFAARIPKSVEPVVSVTRVNQHPTIAKDSFPGGAVYDQIQIELKTEQNDWIWLQVEDGEIKP